MATNGIQSVTVPGCVDGWQKLLDRFGRKKMKDVLAPAIRLADEGFPVTEIFSSYWVASERSCAGTAAPREPICQMATRRRRAKSFAIPTSRGLMQQIAKRGRKGFYEGALARRVLKMFDRLGRHAERGGPGEVFGRVGRADLHDVSRLDGL